MPAMPGMPGMPGFDPEAMKAMLGEGSGAEGYI